MAGYGCSECGRVLEIEGRDLGPFAARGMLEPLRVVCDPCVAALGLVARQDGGKPWLLLRGKEFRRIGGAFVRSEHPEAVRLYDRDEK